MRFRKLRLVGFKSFVEPTEFVIERGLTGVVGPNGCGKSNLVEALRWVMGESSYKNMRASAMDDVIFSGSGKRPARNSAEVALHLDNEARTAPAAFNDADELQVSRRIEREAGSVYRINGRDVRARDVQLLFADVSTGARSPSMIGQGRIGELIAAKPVARRALLEEAAGISGLHGRRHEAELRLRGTEANLERVQDVIGGLEQRLDALRRQARQAVRYRNVAGDIRRTEAAILHLRWRGARDAFADAERAVQAATVRTAEAGLVQSERAREQAVVAHELPALREREAAEAAALQHVTIRREQLDREEKAALTRRREIEGRIEQLRADGARERRLVDENADILAHLAQEREDLQARGEDHERIAAEAEADLSEADEGLRTAEQEADRATAAAAETRAKRGAAERTAREADARTAKAEAESARNERALETLERQPEGGRLEERHDALAGSETAVAAAERALEDRAAALEAARKAEAAAREPLERARARLSAAETEARTLRRILDRATGGAGLLDEVRASAGTERALAAALGDDLDAGRDPNGPIHWTLAEAQDDPALPSGVEPLLGHVDAPPELRRRLAQVGLVDGEPPTEAIAALRPGQVLVSRAGGVWRWDGLRLRADAPTAAAQRLEQRNRLHELDDEVSAVRAERDRAMSEHDERKAALEAATRAERDARVASQDARKALDASRRSLAEAERLAREWQTRRGVLRAEQERLGSETVVARERGAAAHAALAALPDGVAEADAADGARRAVATARAVLVERRAARDAVVRDEAARRERLEAIGREERAWRERAKQAEQQAAVVRERVGEAEAQLAALDAEPDRFEARRRELLGAIGAAERRRADAADALAARERDAREADRLAAAALAELSAAREGAGRAEERADAARERLGEAEARIRDALRCAPHEALALAEAAEDALPPAPDLERKLDGLRGERERLGAVNLRAEEEADEVRGARDDLVRERDDLLEAIRKLRGGIGALNREGRERLLDAFGKVDREFQRLFAHLFGGGTAQLQLVESDDPLEAGLEILARPPGKRPQTMTLLSGGEQALTAMALIFAVFLTNPAPICVLDEVDAPLDDHNVVRFCNLMDEMAAKTATRFVIITHNPITMARMNRLFGVTMGERGVSQLVSVDLEAAEELAEAG